MGDKKIEMTSINHLISQKPSGPDPWVEPDIFDLSKPVDKNKFVELLSSRKIQRIYDQIDIAISELYDIHNPHNKDSKKSGEVNKFKEKIVKGNPELYGAWVYYPWSGSCVHFPSKDDLHLLRTSRNRNLINAEEQQKLYESTILIVGLSVGSSAVEMLLAQGIGGKLILVDMDIIEPTNLNRIKTTYNEVGTHKVDALAKRISETDPFIEQVHIKEGLNETNIEAILKNHQPKVIIDEMDDLRMKIVIREKASKFRLPVIMATDDGENAILDIERYDKNSDQQPFEGKIPIDIRDKIIKGELSRPEIGILIGKHFVGAKNIPLRMFESLMEVGKTIPSWPQLAGAATLSGVTLAYASKKIILNQPLKDGRHIFDLDKELDPHIETAEYKEQLDRFQKLFFS